MTRINVIPVNELSDVHLLAEHREIKRIPNCISKGKYNLSGMPEKYTLGTGHVKFFYDKLGFLYNRYLQLYKECCNRGFNVINYKEAFIGCPGVLFNDYIPTAKAKYINRKRINIRTTESALKKFIKSL